MSNYYSLISHWSLSVLSVILRCDWIKDHATQIFIVDFLDQLHAFQNSLLLQAGLLLPKQGYSPEKEATKKKKKIATSCCRCRQWAMRHFNYVLIQWTLGWADRNQLNLTRCELMLVLMQQTCHQSLSCVHNFSAPKQIAVADPGGFHGAPLSHESTADYVATY